MDIIPYFVKQVLKATFLRAVLLGAVLTLVACVAVPVQEMSDARQAVDAARKAGAESHASEELQSAEALLLNAEQALQDGDYKQAREDAAASRAQAVQAQNKSHDQ